MAGVLADEDKLLLCDVRLTSTPFDNLELHLFTGSLNPTRTTTKSTYDANELSGTGYAAQAVSGWAAAALSGDGHAYSLATPLTFTNSGGSPWTTVTGWYWVDVANGVAVMGGRFGAPWTLAAGGSFPVTPYFQLTGE